VTEAAPALADVLEEVRRIDVQTRRLVRDVMAGSYLSVFRGSGLEFETVREYEPGDPQRAVDWNVTARMGRPFVKTFVDERQLTVLFLVDLSASMEGGFGGWSLRQTAARACACLAFAAIRNGDKVGLIAASDRVDAWVAPGKGASHGLRIVRDVLAARPRGTRTDLRPALAFAGRAVRRHAVLFVVSDFLSEGWERELRVAARRHDVIAVRLLPPELDLPRAGLLETQDPETGQVGLLDTSSRRVRAAWAARVAAWRQRTDAAFRRARVDALDLPAGDAGVAGPILAFFRMREQRGTKR
jgi:uncharacterized protein (DUF58 family)